MYFFFGNQIKAISSSLLQYQNRYAVLVCKKNLLICTFANYLIEDALILNADPSNAEEKGEFYYKT